jgi:hypothetical protein
MGEEFSASKKTALGGWQGWLTVFWGFLFLYFFDAVSTVIKALRAGLSGAGLVWTVAFGVVGVFSFIAAVSLVYVRPNAVTTAKLFLLAQATFALALYIKVLFGSGATLNSAQQFTRNILIPSLLFTVVWYLYLIKSKHVQATYSRDYSLATEKQVDTLTTKQNDPWGVFDYEVDMFKQTLAFSNALVATLLINIFISK